MSGGIFLSGGQKQRLALARALYGNPSIFILDEPNSNLDEHGERALLNVIQNLKSANKTILLISHRSNIAQLADFTLTLNKGKVIAYIDCKKGVSVMNNL